MSWLNALGWVGSALLIFSLLQSRVLRFRIINLCASTVLTVFNGFLHIWPMVAMNIALATINTYFLRKLLRERHDEKAFQVVEVRPDDAYLHYVLKVHRADIAKFQPGLAWDPDAPGQCSYLVLHGDETVGVVLMRDGGAGIAQVVLDYVTPRFRDFSPGEFVWRSSGLLRNRGFNRVVTPRGMVSPYYERVGFHREGEVFALEL